MAVVAITGGPGAPGATSAALALLLSWPLTEHRRVLLVEADPDGGAVLAGALQGEVQADKGLRNLAVSDRRGRLLQEMWDQCIDLSPQGTGDRLLLPGLTDPAQAAALVYTWEPLAEACRTLDGYGCDVIVDLGRSGGHGPSGVLARRADAVLAVLRTTLRGLSAARPRVAALAAELAQDGASDALALLLVREGPYAAAEISRALGAPVVGLLPFAPKEARVLSDGGGRTTDRRFQRSELMRAARSTGDELRALTARRRVVARAPQPAPDVPSIPPPAQDIAPDLYAVPAPTPLRAVPTPPPFPPAAGTTHLGYRQAHAQSAPITPEPPAAPSPWPPHDLPHRSPPHAPPPSPVPSAAEAATAARPWPAHDAPSPAVAAAGSAAGQWPAREVPPHGVPVPQPGWVDGPRSPAATNPAAAGSWPYGNTSANRPAQSPMPAEAATAARPWPVHDSPPAEVAADSEAGRWSDQAAQPGPMPVPRPEWAPGPKPQAAAAGPRLTPAERPIQAPMPADATTPAGSWPVQSPPSPAVATVDSEAGRWSAQAGVPGTGPGPRASVQAGNGSAAGREAWSVREVLDLAAAAELGARGATASGPAPSPIGPVTPGQAARLQSVHLEPSGTAQATGEGAGNPFNPPNMVAMPPLAEHAPRPPAPGEFRPADDGEHGDGNGPAGEVARVR